MRFFIITTPDGTNDIVIGPDDVNIGTDVHGWTIHRQATKEEYETFASLKLLAERTGSPRPQLDIIE